jgi:hypothetical protein
MTEPPRLVTLIVQAVGTAAFVAGLWVVSPWFFAPTSSLSLLTHVKASRIGHLQPSAPEVKIARERTIVENLGTLRIP